MGALAEELGKAYMRQGSNGLLFHTVAGWRKGRDGRGLFTIRKNNSGAKVCQVCSRFVFVGASGWALFLLQVSVVNEIRGFIGYPLVRQVLRVPWAS